LNLHDQHLRLLDLELALQALAQAFTGPGSAKRDVLDDAAQRLRVKGAPGAASLLAGALADAPYRR
jgi:hypothetical protein